MELEAILLHIQSNWIEWLFAALTAGLAFAYRQLSKRMKAATAENDAIRQGLRALLRDRLIQQHNYYMEKGCWPIYARDSMLDMFRQYTSLGGNGAITSIIKDMDDLPTDKKE